jgi:hypothetical protein
MNSLLVSSDFVFSVISIEAERELAVLLQTEIFSTRVHPGNVKGPFATGRSKIDIGKFYR